MERAVNIPEGIEIELQGFKASVSGKKGKIEKDFYSPMFSKDVKIEKSGNTIKITAQSEKRKVKSMVGTIEAILNSMIKGVTEGYSYNLKTISMHFPLTVKVSGNEVLIQNFLGEKSPRKAKVVEGAKVEVNGDEITVSGVDKEIVSQTAANIETATKIKSRDRRIFQDGIYITKKE